MATIGGRWCMNSRRRREAEDDIPFVAAYIMEYYYLREAELAIISHRKMNMVVMRKMAMMLSIQ